MLNSLSESIYNPCNSIVYPIMAGLPLCNLNQPFFPSVHQSVNAFSANQNKCHQSQLEILMPNQNLKEGICNYAFSSSLNLNSLPSLNSVASSMKANNSQEAVGKLSDSNSNSYCFPSSLDTTPSQIQERKSKRKSYESLEKEEDSLNKDKVVCQNKSLTDIAKNFLKVYGGSSDIIIPLDKCTDLLNTERRRIYDIMNIFEGFGAVYRQSKNKYCWKGINKVLNSLAFIQNKCNIISKQLDTQDDFDIDERLEQYEFNRTKSLGFLCESFICLMIWKPIISLEEAANKISKILKSESQLKTRVRRLYDIANVLCVMKVIRKTLLPDTGKPAFQWIGIEGIRQFCKESSIDIKEEISATLLKDCHMSNTYDKQKILNNMCNDFAKQVLTFLIDSNTYKNK